MSNTFLKFIARQIVGMVKTSCPIYGIPRVHIIQDLKHYHSEIHVRKAIRWLEEVGILVDVDGENLRLVTSKRGAQ